MTGEHRPQDDVPHEVIVKHIIRDYRRINHHVEEARKYAEDMEKENKELRAKLAHMADIIGKERKLRHQERNMRKYLASLLQLHNIPFNYKNAEGV